MNERKKINARPLSLKAYLLLFLFILVFCGGFSGLLLKLYRSGDFSNTLNSKWASLFIFLYILVIVLTTCWIFFLVKNKYLDKPIKELQIAARKVSEGDFTVHLEPYRKDGKTDEIELLYEDFNVMVRELASTQTLKTDFISNVSHEIKTPIAVIENYASYLQDETLNKEEAQDYVKTIIQSSKRLSMLVNDILSMNKLQHLEILPQGEVYLLDEQIRQSVINYENQWNAKDIDVVAEMDEIKGKYNKNMLEILWNNLISNAIKFTPEKGKIVILLTEQKDFIQFSIQDSGQGMNENTIQHIFDRFYQGDTSHFQEGNGLGLAMVKKICNLYNAKITVESKVNHGTTFIIKFPKK
ncbi:HAMP domain-containing sensor histidine kinase [Liquorilactobacillus mali]|uniref:HAMP domain-containing sensor histidine kinase n=1 Tax=Liquorilactobacillus mali TaxID=1618 RepID=UPI00234FFC96|nr:HAMP domain-containing sensor histidine kinase [Liquorilactobacillus mali]MDC7952827.1 HAMP domain-containing histidine kinase [Liquorilactobacillus mali]